MTPVKISLYSCATLMLMAASVANQVPMYEKAAMPIFIGAIACAIIGHQVTRDRQQEAKPDISVFQRIITDGAKHINPLSTRELVDAAQKAMRKDAQAMAAELQPVPKNKTKKEKDYDTWLAMHTNLMNYAKTSSLCRGFYGLYYLTRNVSSSSNLHYDEFGYASERSNLPAALEAMCSKIASFTGDVTNKKQQLLGVWIIRRDNEYSATLVAAYEPNGMMLAEDTRD